MIVNVNGFEAYRHMRESILIALSFSCEAPPAEKIAKPLRDVIAIADSTNFPTGSSSSAIKQRRFAFGMLSACGIHSIRRDFLWHEIEPKRGQFVFDPYDALVDDAQKWDIEILALLAYGNPWAAKDAHHNNVPPDDPADFATFAAAVADHFRNRVNRYEIWNEPNNPLFWLCSCPESEPTRYADLLATSVAALHATVPAVQVGFAGTVYLMPSFLTQSSGPDYVRAALISDMEAVPLWDAMAFHAYSTYPPVAPPEAEGVFVAGRDPEVSLLEKIAVFKQLLADVGRLDTPLWLTEIGWPVSSAGVSEQDQARYLIRAILLAAAHTEVIALFNLSDGENPESLPPEQAFGLLHTDGTPKLAYEALRSLLGTLGAYHVESCEVGDVIRCSLRHDIHHAIALWRVDGTSVETLPQDYKTVMTMLGKQSSAKSSITVGQDPIYLLSDFKYHHHHRHRQLPTSHPHFP